MVRERKRETPAAPGESDAVMASVAKVHGPNIIRKGSIAGQWKHIPTDVFTLDMALFGGVPRSVPSMFYGWEASGKTTLGIRALGNAQRMFPSQKAVLVDAEGTYDPVWGASHGVDNDRLVYVQPETGEQALDITNALIRSDDVAMVMVDSLPALIPIKMLQKSLEDEIVALQARLIGRFIATVNQALIDERKRGHLPALLLINQWRSKIAMMGDTRNLPGGNALKFFIFDRVELLNKEVLGRNQYDIETVLHNDHGFKITKTKEGTGIRNGSFRMIRDPSNPLGAGFIDDAETVLAFAKKYGLYSGAGKHQRFDDLDMTFGTMKEAAEYFYSDLDYYDRMKKRLIGIQRAASGLSADGWL